MASPTKFGYTPNKQGVNFFHHLPRFRLRPYDEIKPEYTSDEQMIKTASVRNCEFLKRPQIALSEMAETVSSNLPQLEHLFENLSADTIMPELRRFNDMVASFNSRAGQLTTEGMVHDLLAYIVTDDDEDDDDDTQITKDDIFDGIEILGNILYLIGHHYRQMRVLVQNPAEYSQRCDLPLNHDFKKTPM